MSHFKFVEKKIQAWEINFSAQKKHLLYFISQWTSCINKQIIHPNQYNSAGGTSASYTKLGFKNYGKIKYFSEICTG